MVSVCVSSAAFLRFCSSAVLPFCRSAVLQFSISASHVRMSVTPRAAAGPPPAPRRPRRAARRARQSGRRGPPGAMRSPRAEPRGRPFARTPCGVRCAMRAAPFSPRTRNLQSSPPPNISIPPPRSTSSGSSSFSGSAAAAPASPAAPPAAPPAGPTATATEPMVSTRRVFPASMSSATSLPSRSPISALRDSSFASAPTELNTLLTSSAEGLALPPSTQRMYAAMCFMFSSGVRCTRRPPPTTRLAQSGKAPRSMASAEPDPVSQ